MISQAALEEAVLSLLCWDDERAASLAVKIPSSDIFTNPTNRQIAVAALDHIKKFGNAPKGALEYLLEADMRRGQQGALLAQQYDFLRKQAGQVDAAFVLEQLERFVASQQLTTQLRDALELLGQGELEKAQETAFKNRGLGPEGSTGIWLKDPQQALSFLDLEEQEEFFSSGVDLLDVRGVRPSRKTLYLFLGAAGRGKCIAENELVVLPDGSRITIKKAVEQKITSIISFSEEQKKFVVADVNGWWKNGKKKCYKITTRLGREISVSEDHPFLTETGWKAIKDIDITKDKIAVPLKLSDLGKNKVEPEVVRLLAYLIAEGGLTQNTPTFTNIDPTIQKDFQHCVEFLGDRCSFGKDNKSWEEGFCYIVCNEENKGKHNSKVKELLRLTGLAGKKSNVKCIPEFIFNLNDELIAEFLKVFFSCDGSIYAHETHCPVIELSLSSKRLVEDINYLLMRLGIIAKFDTFTAEWKGKQLPGYAYVVITGKLNVLKFIKKIGFIVPEKVRRANIVVDRFGIQKLVISPKRDKVCYARKNAEVHYYNKNGKLISYKPQQKLITYSQPECSYTAKIAFPKGCIKISDNAFFDSVKTIEYVGDIETYDLSVKDNHNFIAGNIITHNSWFLVNVGKHSLMHHHSVLHITLENDEKMTAQRYIQSLFSLTRDEAAEVNTAYFETDVNGQVSIQFRNIQRNSIPAKRRELHKRLLDMKSYPRLLIKEFPTGALTVPQLTLYLEQLKQEQNFVPDCLVLDYADLMYLNADSLRIDTGRLYRDLRGLAVARNMAVVTATQGNRESESAKLVTSTNVAEDWSKIGTADIVVTYSQTPEEQRLGLARLYVQKSRNTRDRFLVLLAQAYSIGQFALSSTMMSGNISNTISELKEEA